MIHCCVCRAPAVMLIYDRGWHMPSCLSCWPKIAVLKDSSNLPISGELVYL